MARNRLYVFAYDVADDGRRRRMARTLEKAGLRVQFSVFEVRATHEQAAALAKRLSRLLAKGDSLRVYHVPDSALGKCAAFGGVAMPEPGDYLMF